MATTPQGTFVWGGAADDGETPPLGEFEALYLDDGAIIEGTGRSGGAVAPSPFEAPLRGVSATNVGDDVLVVGTTCAEAADMDSDQPVCRPTAQLGVATYDPAADTWRAIELPPELHDDASWIWVTAVTDDGRAVVHVATAGTTSVWVLDVAEQQWTLLEEDYGWSAGECVTGSHLVRLTSPAPGEMQTRSVSGPGLPPATTTQVTTLDLDAPDQPPATSSPLPADLAFVPEFGTLTCTDTEALVAPWDVASPIRRYDVAADTWHRSSPPPPLDDDVVAQLSKPVWTREELLLLNTFDDDPGLAYAPATDTWRVLDAPGEAAQPVPDHPLWTPNGVAVWGSGGMRILDLG
jgi:hypothetical protein